MERSLAMATYARASSAVPFIPAGEVERVRGPAEHIAWFGAGLAAAFLTPYVLTGPLDLQNDIYYLMYFAVALSFLYAYVRWSGVDLRALFSRGWRWSLALGLVVAVFVVINVLSRDSTPHPSGPYFVFQLFWRGGVYGAVDALLLTAFPGLVAFGVLRGQLAGILRRAAYVVLAAALVMIVTGVYHLGYQQFREDGIAGPETGNIIISVPMLATLNPVGSVLAHASMHVAAEAHAHETDVFLPPQVETD
jgi:hypothetical protein